MVINPPSGSAAPSGPAGGELAGTYPNPTVATVLPHNETIGPAARALTIGDIIGLNNFAGIINSALTLAIGNYGFLQDSSGDTTINATAGAPVGVAMAINNVARFTVTNTLAKTAGADLAISTAGRGLQVKEGANARMGVATVTAGSVTVANTSITASTRILLSDDGVGNSRETARVVGTSFTIGNGNALDNATKITWFLMEPAA